MARWNYVELRTFVERLYGTPQRDLVAPSSQSTWRRMEYARYHYHRAELLVDDFVRDHVGDKVTFATVSHGPERVHFENLMIECGAELLGCVQSLHALADILARTIYYGLGLNRRRDRLAENQLGAKAVIKSAKVQTDTAVVREKLRQLIYGGNFNHIAALSNKAKHSDIVAPILSEDWTGTADKKHKLKFAACNYNGKTYPEVFASEFLGGEFDRCARLYVDAGVALNEVLRRRCVRANLSADIPE